MNPELQIGEMMLAIGLLQIVFVLAPPGGDLMFPVARPGSAAPGKGKTAGEQDCNDEKMKSTHAREYKTDQNHLR